jgi:acyl-CoA synthetase (AMP-forming)/AMP-acid ligase II
MPADITELNESASVGLRAPFRDSRLVNEDGSPTPVGELGELWVRGRGLFKGYWNRPDANAASFDGEWFKTGDLMRQDELGFFWLCGRKKEMIRRSSENIAAHEVETVICEIAGVAGAAAVPVKDAKRGEEVKVFVELKRGVTCEDLPVERILEHARAHLAAFKVPRYVAYIDTIPRITSSNKALKRELIDVSDPLAGVYDGEEKRWR